MNSLPQYLIGIAASCFAYIIGYALGWASPTQKKIEDGELGFDVSEDEFSLVGSIFPLGAMLASLPAGIFINIFARKIIIISMGALFGLSWILMFFANNVIMLYCGRVFQGIASGALCSAVPLYISEISHKSIRGALGSCFQLMITIGILVAYVTGAFVKVRYLAMLGTIFSTVFTISFIFVPESPVFLTKKEKFDKAEQAMRILRGPDYSIDGELNEMKATEAKFKESPTSVWSSLTRKETLKGLYYGIALMVFQQLCGINAVIFYTTDIFEASNKGMSPSTSTIIVGTIQVVATCFAVIFVDRLGRRLLLLPSAVFMAVSTLALGLFFYMQSDDEDSVNNLAWLPLTSVCLFIIMFSIGFGPVPWLITGEIFATDIKGIAASMVTTVNWGLAFLVTKTFVDMKRLMGIGPTFWMFCAITIVGAVFVFFLPETKGKSLQEIQEQLG